MKKSLITLLVFSFVIMGCDGTSTVKTGENEVDYTDLAKCLTERNAVMYGADWCDHCATMKKAFGKAWRYIQYQECDDAYAGGDRQKCIDAGVSGYPTWIIPGIDVLVGSMPLEILAQKSGCIDSLPKILVE